MSDEFVAKVLDWAETAGWAVMIVLAGIMVLRTIISWWLGLTL